LQKFGSVGLLKIGDHGPEITDTFAPRHQNAPTARANPTTDSANQCPFTFSSRTPTVQIVPLYNSTPGLFIRLQFYLHIASASKSQHEHSVWHETSDSSAAVTAASHPLHFPPCLCFQHRTTYPTHCDTRFPFCVLIVSPLSCPVCHLYQTPRTHPCPNDHPGFSSSTPAPPGRLQAPKHTCQPGRL
jgi:hypothetical protein